MKDALLKAGLQATTNSQLAYVGSMDKAAAVPLMHDIAVFEQLFTGRFDKASDFVYRPMYKS